MLQAMILTEEGTGRFVLTPAYHVFDLYQGHQDATLLPITLDAGSYTHGGETIPAVNASASVKDGRVLLTLANMDPNASRTVEASLQGEDYGSVSGRILTAEAMNAHNTLEEPNNLQPTSFDGARFDGETLTVELPPKSAVALEIE